MTINTNTNTNSNSNSNSNSNDRMWAYAAYIAYGASLFCGVPAIIGVIIAYICKDKTSPDVILQTHYNHIISLFWKMFWLTVVGIVLSPIMVGFLILVITWVWFCIRTCQGVLALYRNQAIEV